MGGALRAEVRFLEGLADEAVARYLDCGVWDSGFARVKCRKCPQEFLVAFSCEGRGLCPSCGAKRAAELAALLVDEVVEDVGHAQWVFTIAKMLRVYFLYHRELLGELSRAAAETAKERGALRPRQGGVQQFKFLPPPPVASGWTTPPTPSVSTRCARGPPA